MLSLRICIDMMRYVCYHAFGFEKSETKKQTIQKKGKRMKFGLASGTLFPLPLKTILRKASRAGFDFVEVFLFGHWSEQKVNDSISFAAVLGLTLHFHQVWTTGSSQEREKRIHQVMTLLGLLPPEEYARNEWIPRNARPLVAYAEEASRFGRKSGIWFQSIACQRSLTDRAPRLSCADFLRTAKEANLPIVFDTMHFIEYVLGGSGIEHSHLAASQILHEWQKFWSVCGSQVKEIHFNDFTGKRNLWPGTGTAPLEEFTTQVRQSGWDGCVVPEVHPKFRFPYSAKELLALREKTEQYFA